MAYFAKQHLYLIHLLQFQILWQKHNILISKKLLYFLLYKGIRSLALREKIEKLQPVKRIKILEDKKIIEKKSSWITWSIWCKVNTLRLKAQLVISFNK